MSAYDSDADPLGKTPSAASSESDWSKETSEEEDISGYSREEVLDDPNMARLVSPESPTLVNKHRINLEQCDKNSNITTPQLSTIEN